jgi:hypothetical protein
MLGDVNQLLQTDVKIAIARLPEVLNTWSPACIEGLKPAAGSTFTFNTGLLGSTPLVDYRNGDAPGNNANGNSLR